MKTFFGMNFVFIVTSRLFRPETNDTLSVVESIKETGHKLDKFVPQYITFNLDR